MIAIQHCAQIILWQIRHFNLSNWGADQLKEDVRWKYGTPPASNANFAWLQHMIYHLAPTGRMGMVLANGHFLPRQMVKVISVKISLMLIW